MITRGTRCSVLTSYIYVRIYHSIKLSVSVYVSLQLPQGAPCYRELLLLQEKI
jgi:hypothetical protein